MKHFIMVFGSIMMLQNSPFLQTNIEIFPSQDTYVDSSNPTMNFGKSTVLKFGMLYKSYPNLPLFRTYLVFPLNKFKGRNVKKAELWIYQYGGSGAGTLPKHLRVVAKPWNETSMTWNTKAPYGKLLATFNAGGYRKRWIKLDVTNQVQKWLLGKEPNYGFVLKHPREDRIGAARPAYCYSKEYSNIKYIPRLKLNLSTRFYGIGCGYPHPQIGFQGEPGLGKNFSITLNYGKSSIPSILFYGRSNTNWGSLSLPFDLTRFGFYACYILYAWEFPIYSSTNSKGEAKYSFTVPNISILRGKTIYWQWCQIWLENQVPKLRVSNGLETEFF